MPRQMTTRSTRLDNLIPNLSSFASNHEEDPEPWQKLFRENLGLIGWGMTRFRHRCNDEDALASALTEGLIRAAQGFDPGRGRKFSSYACRCMANAVTDLCREFEPFQMPSGARLKLGHWCRFKHLYGRWPDLEDCNYEGPDRSRVKLAKQLRGSKPAPMSEAVYRRLLDATLLVECQVGDIDGIEQFVARDWRVEAWGDHEYDCNAEKAQIQRDSPEPCKCPGCEDAFTPTKRQQKFCSPECRKADKLRRKRKPREPQTCPWCGSTFTPTGSNQTYCQKSCQKAARAERKRQPSQSVQIGFSESLQPLLATATDCSTVATAV